MTFPLPYGLVVQPAADGRERLDPVAVQGNFDALAADLPSNALQAISGGSAFAIGTGTWTWPGATSKTDVTTVTHGLGGTPLFVAVLASQTQGAAETLATEAYTYTTTTFLTRAQFVRGFTPAAASTAPFVWLAIR